MKKSVLLILGLLTFLISNGQNEFSYANFENQVINFEPLKNNLSDKDFNHALMILNETKKYVKNDPKNFNRGDYFNMLSCFLTLKESDKHIRIAFEKFKDSEGSCEYFLANNLFKSKKYEVLMAEIEEQRSICENSSNEISDSFDIKEYVLKYKLDFSLVQLIDKMNERDIKYRKEEITDWSKQRPLDLKNQHLIDSLYKIHKKYIGTSLVGTKYNSLMWLVIQHSNLEMMKKYLPVIQEAVQNNELNVTPFKMLIDRIYTQTHNYQIFGSQQGVKLADEKIRKEVANTYKLE